MKNRSQRRAERFQRGAEKPLTGRQVFGGFVPFADPASKTSDGWTVLAYEVSMKESGVALSKRDFEDCVRNFASYPCSPVTIEHADTDFNPFAQPPTSWREPNGHVEELRVGTMTRGSKTVATLEGRVSYLEPTASDVAAKKWRFGSITIIQGAVDEETGATLGSMLWSWSLTAHPRLTGLPAIAASKRAPQGGEPVTAGWWYGDIDDRDDLLSCLRTLLDLPVTSTEAEVLAELTKLEGYVADPASAAAAGIETDDIVCRLRDALRLPALTSAADVLAEVRKGLDTLPTDDMPAATTTTPSGAATDPATMSRHTTPEKIIMNRFSLILAALGLAAAASEEEAAKRVEAFSTLGADTLKALGLPLTATPAEVAAKVSTLSADAAKATKLEAELATFRSAAADRAKADRAAYLDDLIAAQPHLAPVRASLALHFESDPTGFATTYPRPSREDLTRAAAEGAQRSQDGARAQGVTVTAANPATKDAPKPAGDTAKPARADFAAVLEEFGYPSDALAVASAIAQGHTPATLRAALSAQA